MSSSADLFVVCKQCGSEVSPYITECPYCGHRLRRRAPKLPRENMLQRGRRGPLRRLAGRRLARRPLPVLARRRLLRWPGDATVSPPYVTIALAALAAYPAPVVLGANSAALGLLAAWVVPDLLAVRGGEYYEGDLLGVGALAALLLAIPFALRKPEASWLAGVTGGAMGL